MNFDNMVLKMVTTDSPGISGNEEGEKNFEADYIQALVREELQNSLDNKSENSEIVRVEFSTFTAKSKTLPAIDMWRDYSRKNYYYWRNKTKNNRIYEDKAFSTLETIVREDINCLRISDHGTTGLRGIDDPNGVSPYSNLVLNTNVSDKPIGNAGSKGIGKSVAFAVSVPKCVYYSSIAEPSEYSEVPEKCFIGNIHATSFKDDGIGYTGFGFFCENDGNPTAKNALPMRECVSLDPNYVRADDDYGTDIFVLGFADDSNRRKIPSKKELILPVLENFMYAIFNGQLEVCIYDNDCINRETLSMYIERYKNDLVKRKAKTTIEYYETLTSPDKHSTFSVGFDEDDCELYLKLNQSFSNTALICRNIGMKILEKNKFRISGTPFSAVICVKSVLANEYLRNLENTTHSKIKDRNDDKKIMDVIYSTVKKSVDELFAKTYSESTEADGLSNYLPLNYILSEESDGSEHVKEGLSTRIVSIEKKEMFIPKPQRVLLKEDKSPFYEDLHGHSRDNVVRTGRKRKRRSIHEEITDTSIVDTEEAELPDEIDNAQHANRKKRNLPAESTIITDYGDVTKMGKKNSRASSLKMVDSDYFVPKLFVKNGRYVVNIMSKKKIDDCYIRIYLSADPLPVKAPIEDVYVDGVPSNDDPKGILIGSFEYGQEHVVEFALKSKGLRSFEIKYHEVQTICNTKMKV